MKEYIYKILKWSEKYTKTDMVYLVSGGFWLTLGNVLISAIIFLAAIAFANLLPKETYGTYKYVLSISGILSLATLGGMESALAQAIAKGNEGTFIPALKTRIKYGLFGFIGSLAIALYYFSQGQEVLFWAFIAISIFIPIMDPFGMYQVYLQNKKLFNISSMYGAMSQMIATSIVIIATFFTKDVLIILLAYFASWTLVRFVFLRLTIKKFPPNKFIEKETVSYGKHNTIINITATAIGSLDSLLLFHYLGASDLATYSFALAPVALLKSTTQYLPTLAMPKLAKRSIKEIEQTIRKRLPTMFGVGLIMTIFYIIASPIIFEVFFPKYNSAIFLSQIFSLSLIMTAIHDILGSVVNSKLTATPKKMLYLWNIPSIVFILSVFFLIGKWGVLGVVISKLLSLLSTIVIDGVLWKNIKNNNPQ